MIFGYLDPGSGSLILQAILGGLAGIAVAFKAWKSKLSMKKQISEISSENPAVDESTLTTES
jgi:hypothetical protein